MDLFTYLMAKNGNNSSVHGDLFSYLLGKGQSQTQTISGVTIYIPDAKKLVSFMMTKESTQEGTPTPDNPVEVKTVKGSVDVYVSQGETTNTYTIDLGNNIIVGIGDYKDELLVDKNGHVFINKKTKKIILDGTQTIGGINTQQTNTTRVTYIDIIENGISSVLLLCNRLTRASIFNSDTEGIYYNVTNGNLFFRINKSTIGTTTNEINTYLSNNNIILYYPTSESQLIDLNTTIDLRLFKGTNTITNSEDGYMTIEYK